MGGGVGYADWLYPGTLFDFYPDLYFKGIRADGFMEYSPAKWLALSLRGYCLTTPPGSDRLGGGTVGIKWVPFRRDSSAFALKIEAGYPVIFPMCYALFDIKNKVTLYFPFGFGSGGIWLGIGCTIPFGNIKESSFIKYITISYGFSSRPTIPAGAIYHETNIGVGVRWIK